MFVMEEVLLTAAIRYLNDMSFHEILKSGGQKYYWKIWRNPVDHNKYIKKKEVILVMEDVLLAAAIGYFNDLSNAACYLIYPTHSLSCAFMPPLII